MSRFVCGLLTALAALVLAAGHPTSAAESKTGGSKAADSDPFHVPDGTIDELQKYIDGLKGVKPSSSLRPAGADFRRKRAAAQLEASEKILAARPTPDQIRLAMRSKMTALVALERLGDTSATAKIDAALEQAKQLAQQIAAEQAAAQQLAAQQEAARQGLPQPPPTPALAPPPGPPQLVRDAQFIVLDGRVQEAAAMNRAQYAQLVDRLADYIKQLPPEGDGARLAVALAMAAEEPKKRDLAIATYTNLGKLLATSKDENVVSTSATMFGAARRLDLAGKPFLLQGATLRGRPIDAKKYKGKVVLVDFFATWCGPCRDEVPNITKCYQAYHKRGFDVVGVSVDRDRKAITEFLDREKYPWTVVLDRYEARGTDKSLATYYGIFTIPQMILLDKDGKVVSLDVRGDRLDKALAELLGPPAAENSKKSAGSQQAGR